MKTYFIGCLYFSKDKLSVWDADAWCQNNGAYLVEIVTKDQMDFLVMELQALEAQTGEQFWWTGGSDDDSEGDWLWQHSQQDVGEFIWGEGYPRPESDSNYHCLYYGLDYMGYDCWAVIPNSEDIHESHYICQQDV